MIGASEAAPLLQTRGLTKRFGSVAALDGVDLSARKGEIHSILGENGAGKTTLMNLLFGILRPDGGTILWKGVETHIDSPADARRRGIGMVHQHFMLAPALTVAENVLLAHPDRGRFLLDHADARRRVLEISERHGLALDPGARVSTLPVGARQRVEIAKAIAHGAELLILDEPTAVLTPKEARDLFRFLRELRERDESVLFISHKMDEVLEISDRITVLRHGRFAGSFARGEADAAMLASCVLGTPEGRMRMAARPARGKRTQPAMTLRALSARFPSGTAIESAELELHEGEIFAIAGVDGNGQEELTAALAGVASVHSGSIHLGSENVTGMNALERHEHGLSVLPGDRAHQGLILDLSIWENLVLRRYGDREANRAGGLWIDRQTHRRAAAHLLEAFDVRGPGLDAKVRSLSGGNQQKVLLAREIGRGPRVLVALNATRGLDIGASADILRRVLQLRDAGAGILWISTDIDEVLQVGDRVGVLVGGRLREVEERDHESVGAAMLTTELLAR